MSRFAAVLLLATVGLAAPAPAQDCLDYREYLHWTGGVATADSARAVVVVGDHAFVADGAAGLTVLDVSDPAAPILLTKLPLSGTAVSLDVAEGLAVVAALDAGVLVVDVTIPAAPTSIGAVATSTPAKDVVVRGAHAYVAAGLAGMFVVSLADPALPAVVGQTGVAWGDARGVAVWEDRAYVANGEWGVFVADIAEPTAPVVVDAVHLDYWFWTEVQDVAVTAAGLFIAATDYYGPTPMDPWPHTALYGVDRASLGNPEWERHLDFGREPAGRLVTVGDLVYGTGAQAGLYVVDGSDPTSPVLLGRSAVRGDACGVAVAGDVAWVAAGAGGLMRVDVAPPDSPPLVATVDVNDEAWANSTRVQAVTHREDLVYVVYSEGGYPSQAYGELAIVDVSDPAEPARLFSGFSWGPNQYGGFAATDIEEQDGYLYVAMDAVPDFLLRVVDVHNPSAPVDLGFVPGLSCRDLLVFGRYAYAIGADAHLRVLDRIDPAAPMVVGSVDVGGGTTVAKVDAGICVLQSGGLVILSIADPSSPQIISTTSVPGFAPVDGVETFRDTFFAADEQLGLVAFDLAAPGGPTVLSALALPGTPRRLDANAPVMALACRDGGVQLVNVEDPAHLVPVGSLPGFALDVDDAFFGLFVAVDDVLAIAHADCANIIPVDGTPDVAGPAACSLTVHPNPFNPRTTLTYEVPQAGPARLQVFDLRGRFVRSLIDGAVAAGRHEVQWDGRNESGRDQPNGIYLSRLEAGGQVARGRMTLLR